MVEKFKSRQQLLSQPLAGFVFTSTSGRQDTVRTFSRRHPALGCWIEATTGSAIPLRIGVPRQNRKIEARHGYATKDMREEPVPECERVFIAL
jgi:hypothetical protein